MVGIVEDEPGGSAPQDCEMIQKNANEEAIGGGRTSMHVVENSRWNDTFPIQIVGSATTK